MVFLDFTSERGDASLEVCLSDVAVAGQKLIFYVELIWVYLRSHFWIIFRFELLFSIIWLKFDRFLKRVPVVFIHILFLSFSVNSSWVEHSVLEMVAT